MTSEHKALPLPLPANIRLCRTMASEPFVTVPTPKKKLQAGALAIEQSLAAAGVPVSPGRHAQQPFHIPLAVVDVDHFPVIKVNAQFAYGNTCGRSFKKRYRRTVAISY